MSIDLENNHQGFLIQCLTAKIESNSPSPSKAVIEASVETLREKLTSEYGGLDRKELKRLEMFRPYITYFKRFKKTYHLFLQLESFVHKQKPLPFIHPLVSAYFLSELETGILASAHDLEKINSTVSLHEAKGDEAVRLLNGEERSAPRGDAVLKDSRGVLTSVIQGQDVRSVIGAQSRQAAFFVYGPPGASDSELQKALQLIAGHLEEWYGSAVRFTFL